ncbi:hypothetical protein BDV29DRAFT_195190 [Aspergillus leporis]|uniref:BTB domain-containing protein n=1 Tax=Aspergillus leporis TaxID=41062 RepID=A0A5N5WKH9_9EURO|nr:hypothetical protein BDV29DRAFT_195190 [Aspergillus leporis]
MRQDHRVYESKIVKFVVGPTRLSVSLHSGLLSSFPRQWVKSGVISPGGQDENVVLVGDQIKDIFAYICQYLYTGDYTVPLPESTVPSPIYAQEQHDAVKGHRISLKGNIFASPALVSGCGGDIVRGIEPQPTHPSKIGGGEYHEYDRVHNYSEALLAHARLSVYGLRYRLVELHNISNYKLLHMLNDFPLHKTRVGDIVRVLRFVFNTESKTASNVQAILLEYTTLYLEHFLGNDEFQELLRDLPSLSTQLLNWLGGDTHLLVTRAEL